MPQLAIDIPHGVFALVARHPTSTHSIPHHSVDRQRVPADERNLIRPELDCKVPKRYNSFHRRVPSDVVHVVFVQWSS